jgi:16S rRNA processing protein RimM
MRALVARVGKAHGLRGEVTVQLHTQDPYGRFVPGVPLHVDPPQAGPLTLRSARSHNGTWLLAFHEASDREAAERLRGVRLFVDLADEPTDEDSWYEDELRGLRVVDPAGAVLGEVAGLLTRPVQDLLVVRLTDGREALVPFVAALVPVVDPAGGRVVVDAPAGLFDLGAS